MVNVLVLVFFFHGGLIGTKALQAPTLEDCQSGGASIVAMSLGKDLTFAGQTLHVDQVVANCLTVAKPINARL